MFTSLKDLLLGGKTKNDYEDRDYKLYFLGEPVTSAVNTATDNFFPVIKNINELPLEEQDTVKCDPNWKLIKDYNKYLIPSETDSIPCICLFFSRLLAEVACKLANEIEGNHFEVIEATPENLLLHHFDMGTQEIKPLPEHTHFTIRLGVVHDDQKKTVFSQDGYLYVDGQILFTDEEKQSYLTTGLVPDSIVNRIKEATQGSNPKRPEWYMESSLAYQDYLNKEEFKGFINKYVQQFKENKDIKADIFNFGSLLYL